MGICFPKDTSDSRNRAVVASEGVYWEEVANAVTVVAGMEDVVVNMVIDVEVTLLTSVLVFGVKDVVPDIVVDVVAVVVVRVVVVHPANPNKIIKPHTQIPNSNIFFLNMIHYHPSLFI